MKYSRYHKVGNIDFSASKLGLDSKSFSHWRHITTCYNTALKKYARTKQCNNARQSTYEQTKCDFYPDFASVNPLQIRKKSLPKPNV